MEVTFLFEFDACPFAVMQSCVFGLALWKQWSYNEIFNLHEVHLIISYELIFQVPNYQSKYLAAPFLYVPVTFP